MFRPAGAFLLMVYNYLQMLPLLRSSLISCSAARTFVTSKLELLSHKLQRSETSKL